MVRKEILLDCTRLTVDSRWGRRMFARLRYYYGSKYAHFNRASTDLEVHEYAYLQYYGPGASGSISKERVTHDHQAWLDGKPAPDYLCSELRRALKDRDHRLVSVEHLERYAMPVAV